MVMALAIEACSRKERLNGPNKGESSTIRILYKGLAQEIRSCASVLE